MNYHLPMILHILRKENDMLMFPHIVFRQAVVVFLIGAICNHVPTEEASKFVVIGCTIVAILVFLVRCALLCYRNKRRQKANIRMIDELYFHS